MKQTLIALAICAVSITVQAQCWSVQQDEFTGTQNDADALQEFFKCLNYKS